MNVNLVSINNILLIRYPDNSMQLGEALWAASKEVENFYNFGEQRAVFRRSYLSETMPESIQKKGAAGPSVLKKMWDFFTGSGNQPVEKEANEVMMNVSQADSKWDTAEAQYVRSYDAGKIAQLARELAGERPSDETQVVVTDLVLVPPPEWRYVIWDGNVISIAPTDPEFWNMKDSNRNAIIKHRVRTACLSVVGQLIGLRRCDNERCFLFGNVDSVTRLDNMVVLGPEHNIEALSQRGFEIFAEEPGKVQPITDNPKTEAESELR